MSCKRIIKKINLRIENLMHLKCSRRVKENEVKKQAAKLTFANQTHSFTNFMALSRGETLLRGDNKLISVLGNIYFIVLKGL